MEEKGLAVILDSAYNPRISMELWCGAIYQWKKKKMALTEPVFYNRSDRSKHLVELFAKAYADGHRVILGGPDPVETEEILNWFRAHTDAYWLCMNSNVDVLPSDENVKPLVTLIDVLIAAGLNVGKFIGRGIIIRLSPEAGSNGVADKSKVGSPARVSHRMMPRVYCEGKELAGNRLEKEATQFWEELKKKEALDVSYLFECLGEEETVEYAAAYYKVFSLTPESVDSRPELIFLGHSLALYDEKVSSAAMAHAPADFEFLEHYSYSWSNNSGDTCSYMGNLPPFGLFVLMEKIMEVAEKMSKELNYSGHLSESSAYLNGVYYDWNTYCLNADHRQKFPAVKRFTVSGVRCDAVDYNKYKLVKEKPLAESFLVPLRPIPFLLKLANPASALPDRKFFDSCVQIFKNRFRVFAVARFVSAGMPKLTAADQDLFFSEGWVSKPLLEMKVKLLSQAAVGLDVAATKTTEI